MRDAGKAGAYRPGSLGRAFARVPLELITTMLDAGMPIKWAVMLAIMSYCGEGENGTIWASCARSAICCTLGITERQARTAASSLIRSGILSVLEPGHNGRATVYRVNVKGDTTPAPTTAQTIPTTKNTTPTAAGADPSAGAAMPEGERGVSGNLPYGAVEAGPETTPNRTFAEGSYGGTSAEEELSAPEVRVEGPSTGPEGDEPGYVTVLRPMPIKSGEPMVSLFHKGGGHVVG